RRISAAQDSHLHAAGAVAAPTGIPEFRAPARCRRHCLATNDSGQRWERIAVDMMDKASALPTCPQRQQQKQPTDFTIGLKASTRLHDEGQLLWPSERPTPR